MNDIFISYASEDRDRVEPLATALEKVGWSVFWDRDILPGENYMEIIENELKSARCVIVVWSRNSVSSKWVRAEAEKGLKNDILVPVKFEEVEIPLPFSPLQAANLIGWSGEKDSQDFQQLMKAINSILGEPRKQKRQKPAVKPKKRKTSKPKTDPPESAKKEPLIPGLIAKHKEKLAYGMAAALICVGIIAVIVNQRSGPVPPVPKDEPIHIKDLNMVFVPVPPESSEAKSGGVEITEPFYLQTTEVTKKQWEEIMGDSNISAGTDQTTKRKSPAVNIDVKKAQKFIQKLNQKYSENKYDFRLPTEAEWEYACRAGTEADFAFKEVSDKITDYAWLKSNSRGKPNVVGKTFANRWELHDMLGNVMELCDNSKDKENPVVRGGSFRLKDKYANCGVSEKLGQDLHMFSAQYNKIGLRVAVEPKKKEEIKD